MTQINYVNIKPEHAPQIPTLQVICFPYTDPTMLFTDHDMCEHYRVFPEGTFIALDGKRVVGMAAGFFVDFDFTHPQHTLEEISGESGVDNHNSDGAWYYGTDISVHPDYRRQGIGKKFYELRKQLAYDYNRRGIIAGGVLPGFSEHKAHMSALDYVDKVAADELYDPTLTFQIRNGFQVRGVLKDYFDDKRSDSWASLIVWENPQYKNPDISHAHAN